MDLTIVSEILKELLPFYSQISMPGLGSFVVTEKPSEILENGTLITPPVKDLKFSFAIGNNDGLMEKEYAKLYNTNIHEARLEIEKIIKEIRTQLTQYRKVRVPQLGEFQFNENGELLFVPSHNASVFSPISIPQGVHLAPKETSTHTGTETSEAEIIKVPVESIVPPEYNQSTVDYIIDSAIMASVYTKQCKDVTAEPQAEVETAVAEKPAAEPEKEEQPAAEEKQPVAEEKQPVAEEKQPVAGPVKPEHKTLPKSYKIALVGLIILIILILLFTIVFVMQDSLRPFLEKILYSPEERALIHHFNM